MKCAREDDISSELFNFEVFEGATNSIRDYHRTRVDGLALPMQIMAKIRSHARVLGSHCYLAWHMPSAFPFLSIVTIREPVGKTDVLCFARYREAQGTRVANTFNSIPLTFEVLNPLQVCEAFTRALARPVNYRRGPVELKVPIPARYEEHLLALQDVLGDQRAPYYGPEMYYPHESLQLWEGNRGIEEYAREAFIIEERMNGLTWMEDDEDGSLDNGDTGPMGTPTTGTPYDSQCPTPSSVGARGQDLNFTGSC